MSTAQGTPSGSPATFTVLLHVKALYKGVMASTTVRLMNVAGSAAEVESPLRAGNDYILFLRQSARVDEVSLIHADGAIIFLFDHNGASAQEVIVDQDIQSYLASCFVTTSNETYKLYYLSLLSQFASLTDMAKRAIEPSTRLGSLKLEVVALSVLVRQEPERYMGAFLEHVAEIGPTGIPDIDVLGDIVASLPTNAYLKEVENVATSANSYLRRSAMFNIRRNASPSAESFLVSQLSFRDDDVQYIAMITLAEMNKEVGEMAPDKAAFSRRPEYYLQLWKSWAAVHGVKGLNENPHASR